MGAGGNSKIEKLAHSLRNAAVKTGMSENHLRNEHKRGKLRLVKSGRRTLILEEDLTSYLKALLELS
jgi:heterodisulfide reductase subunit C